MAETPESFLAFNEQYPNFLGLHILVEDLTQQPDVFPNPPAEHIIDALASMLATKQYAGVYLMSNIRFMYEVIQEYKRLGKQGEVDAIMAMLRNYAPYVEKPDTPAEE